MTPNKPSRRKFLHLSAIAAIGATSKRAFSLQTTNELNFYVGTYTTGRSEGIYLCRLNLASGELSLVDVFKGVANPSFLAIDPAKQHLFAVNETDSGELTAFKIDPATSRLELINQQPTKGAAPCNLVVDKTGQNVLVANYTGGSAAVLPFQNERLGKAVSLVQHRGSSVDPDRQQGPHAHCVTLDKANRFAFVTDLGLDQVKIYKFNSRTGSLLANTQPYVSVKPGAGPRHFTIHPNQRWAYVISELDSTLTAFHYDATSGGLREFQNTPTLPFSFTGKSYPADIHISPSGRFLYGSNRGHDSIAVFAINEERGFLSPVQWISTKGSWPRNFGIDPSGKFLLVANQKSDNIFSFTINDLDGTLTPTGNRVDIPSPVCIQFL